MKPTIIDAPTDAPSGEAVRGAGIPRLLCTPQQAADALQLSATATWELIGSGRLRSIKIGRLRRVPVAALQQFIDEAGQ